MERNRRSGYLGSYFHHLLAGKVHENQDQGGAHGVESASPGSKGMDARDFEKSAVTWTNGKRDGGSHTIDMGREMVVKRSGQGGAWRIVVPQGGEMRAVPEWSGTGRQVSGSILHQDAGAALRETAQKGGGSRSEDQKRGGAGDTELRVT